MKDKQSKKRLDLALIDLGIFETRQEAQAAIMDGAVLVNNEKITKSGTSVSDQDKIELRPGFTKQKYVSRGGLKLEKALSEFQLSVSDRVCLDVGASTGGFTDCLLQHGARTVYAIDVGYGQLDWKLRMDTRVIVRERINARHLSPEELYADGSPKATLAVIDCSFISLDKILPATCNLIEKTDSEIICLVKPQFEAGRKAVNKGVVKDPKVHLEVLCKVADIAHSLNLEAKKSTFSPLKGPKGNIEYLVLLSPQEEAKSPEIDREMFATIVNQAVTSLD